MPLTDPLIALQARVSHELEERIADVRARTVQIRADGARQQRRVRRRMALAARRQAMTEAGIRTDEAAARERQRHDAAVREELDALHSAVTRALLDSAGTPWGDLATVALAQEALESLPTANRIHVHPAHVDSTRQVLDHCSVTAELCPDLRELGAVVSDDAGRRVVNTVGERLRFLWPTARVEIAREWRATRPDRHQAPRAG